MKQKFYSLFLLLAALFVACTSSSDVVTPDVSDEVETPNTSETPDAPDEEIAEAVSFSAQMTTRATDTSFESGDVISVTAYDSDGTIFAQDVSYTFGSALFTSTTPIEFTSTDQLLSFYAIYPYMALPSNMVTSFSVESDQSNSSNYTLSDLMISYASPTSSRTPELTFDHLLSQIVINVTSLDVDMVNVVSTINVATDVEYNLSTLSSSCTSSPTTLTMASNGVNSYKAIVVPQTISAGEILGVLYVNGTGYQYAFGSDINIAAGKKYAFDLTIMSGSVIFTSPTISDWEDGWNSSDGAADDDIAECEVSTLYVGTTSAGFLFVPNSSIYRVDYAFDASGQADEFDSGDLNNIKTLTAESYKAINFFDLTEETEYTLYYKCYDRWGGVSQTEEIAVTTSNKQSAPCVDLELGEIDTIFGIYTFIPNANCSKYSFLVGEDDQYSEIYDSSGWGGDIYSMIISWADFEEDDWGVYSKSEEHEFMLYTLDLYSSTDMEFFVVTYDAAGNPFSLEKFEFSTPLYEATGTALIDKIEEIEVGSYSASFTITPNEHVFATFYALFTQYAWDNYFSYDDCLEDLQYLFLDDYTDGEAVLNIGNEPFLYEEDSTLTPNTTYYVVAIPLDGTGIDTDTGWGTAKTYEFTTSRN